jgi:predicted TIM-barrel fold metal-dependent hydrolase
MIIDLDSHLREGYFMDEVYNLPEPYARFTPQKAGEGRNHSTKFIHSLDPGDPQGRAAHRHPYIYDPKVNWRNGEIAERQVAGYDMERRLRDIKKEGIDKEIIFPTAINVATENIGGLGLACAQAYNDWVAKLVKGYEDVFLPVAMAPAGCPEAMAGELRRCVKELGFKAGHLVPYVGNRNVDHPSFYPYYQAAEELNVALFCHPNSNGELTDRFDNFFKTHVLGRVMNCTPALVALVLGGVFEKFPKLKVVFFECSAEWPLYWMHRMDEDWEWAKDFPQISGELKMAPSEYVKRNCYVTCEADEGDMTQSLKEVGEDHILMATDFPHFDSEYPHTVSGIRERTDLTARQKDKILGENAARILNF